MARVHTRVAGGSRLLPAGGHEGREGVELPDQELEGDGPGLLGEVMLQDSAVHLQPLTLATARGQHQASGQLALCVNQTVIQRSVVELLTYLSSTNVSPKYSFSLRLKWEDTKSRSSLDSSLGC